MRKKIMFKRKYCDILVFETQNVRECNQILTKEKLEIQIIGPASQPTTCTPNNVVQCNTIKYKTIL